MQVPIVREKLVCKMQCLKLVKQVSMRTVVQFKSKVWLIHSHLFYLLSK